MATALATARQKKTRTINVLEPPGTGVNPVAVHPDYPDLHAEWVEVTPQLAAEYLELNEKNRSKRQDRIDAMAADILGDDWQPNGASIVFAPNGTLLDGQHRCEGIVKAGKPALTLIVWGVDEEARKVIDNGAARKVSDYLTMLEGIRNPAAAAAIASRWYSWNNLEADQRILVVSRKPSSTEIIDTFMRDRDVLIKATQFAVSARNKAGKPMYKITPALWGITYMILLSAVMGDRAAEQVARNKPLTPDDDDCKQVEWFLGRIATGIELAEDDPAYAARNRIQTATTTKEGKFGQKETLYVLLASWMLWRGGKKAKKIPIPRLGVTADNFPGHIY